MNNHVIRFLLVSTLLLTAGYGIGTGSWSVALVAGTIAIALSVGFPSKSASEHNRRATDVPPSPQNFDVLRLADLEMAAMILDRQGAVLAVNADAVKLFGDSVGEDVALALRYPAALDAVKRAIREQREVTAEVEGIGLQTAVHRLRAAPTENGGFIVTFADVSSARAAERMRADFVANSSHELRTPLATLAGFIETLQGPAADDMEASTRFLGLMAEEAARMTRLIDDLLSLSRVELDKNLRPRQSVRLAPLIREFAETMAVKFSDWDRSLIIEVEDDIPNVIGDRDQLLQIFNNLVSNSLKYGHAGTPVTITAARMPGGVAVRVTDSSDGIAPEHLPRLTERFYRVDAGRSRKLGGTGLGLAIVKHMVERHRGRLDIRSTQGVGTTVSFSLPESSD
ncbi:ATPase [Pacificimonas sp. WHA3]|uniref:histidine kinase n=1 Tax=Pacificimonas pallii TaxID=2827236 RepID=A0ABS6SEH1_9SPHN|nr:ATP-binding protein [Pacificimonas pallii]MBV7256809.1 ATPase [Pacificimonas pallii]